MTNIPKGLKEALTLLLMCGLLFSLVGCGGTRRSEVDADSGADAEYASVETADDGADVEDVGTETTNNGTSASAETLSEKTVNNTDTNGGNTDANNSGETQEVSEEQQWADLKQYADMYVSGEWDGEAVYRPDWHGGSLRYANINDDGSLCVGSLYPVIPGAILSDVSVDSLRQAYFAGEGWTQVNSNADLRVWSEDYHVECEISKSTGYLSIFNHYHDDDYGYHPDIEVFDAFVYDGKELSFDRLAVLRRSGEWDGSRLWAPNTPGREVVIDRGCGLEIFTPGSGWKDTNIFPAVGSKTLGRYGLGYTDPETGRTIAVLDGVIALYEADGMVVKKIETRTNLQEGYNEAFVAPGWRHPEIRDDLNTDTLVYTGDGNLYRVNFEKGVIETLYENVLTAEWGYEYNLDFAYLKGGKLYAAGRDYREEVIPDADYTIDNGQLIFANIGQRLCNYLYYCNSEQYYADKGLPVTEASVASSAYYDENGEPVTDAGDLQTEDMAA